MSHALPSLVFPLRSVAWIVAFLLSAASAQAIELRFTNAEVDLGNGVQIPLTDQYASYGVTFEDVYRYVDSRDPFSDGPYNLSHPLGIANGNPKLGTRTLGRVNFVYPTDASGISFDWYSLNTAIKVNTYGASGEHLGEFIKSGSGSASLPGQISYFTFSDSTGFVALSNLRFTQAPEPNVAVAVFAAAAAFFTWRRRQR